MKLSSDTGYAEFVFLLPLPAIFLLGYRGMVRRKTRLRQSRRVLKMARLPLKALKHAYSNIDCY